MHKKETRQIIVDYIKQHGEVRPTELLDSLLISRQMLHRHLKDLQDAGVIEKMGKSPKTFYTLVRGETPYYATDGKISSDISLLIEDNFLHITPAGKRLVGMEAFIYWCNKRGLSVATMAKQYADVIKKYAKIRAIGLLDATTKMRNVFTRLADGLCIDKVFYIDFYSLETFGKTKLGQMLLYAKQSQDKAAIWQIADMVKSKIAKLLKEERIDAVAYVPPTVKRSVQFMKVLERRLAFDLPKIEIIKILGDVAVPQKTLKNLEDRIENANASFALSTPSTKFNKVLVIDDAVGSGASLNQIACKIKKAGIAKKVIGIAITGSLNNFDVISEV